MSDPLPIFAQMLANLDDAGLTGLRVEAWVPSNASITMAFRGSEQKASDALSVFATNNLDSTILNTGPGTWLLLGNTGVAEFPDLDGETATFDQGDGYAFLRLYGRAAMTVLQKGIFVDLDLALAGEDSCVSSVIAHVSVTVWRVSANVIGVAVPRSFAGSFWHWLSAAAAAEGISIGR